MFRPTYYEDDMYEEARKYAHISDRPLIFVNPFRSSGYEKIYSVKTLPLSYPVGITEPSDKPTWSTNPINQELWNLQRRGYQMTSTGIPQEDERMKERIKEIYSLLTPYQKKPDSTSGNTQTAAEKQDQAKNAVAAATGHPDATDAQKSAAVGQAVPMDNIQQLNQNISTLSDALKQFTSSFSAQPIGVPNSDVVNPTNANTRERQQHPRRKANYTGTRRTANVSDADADTAMDKTEHERDRKAMSPASHRKP